jgi:P-type E1-E2 ATPase
VPDPPTSAYSLMIPLVFVVLVTAMKQAYEDILRHKSDREVNNMTARILRDGKFVDKKWKDVKVGDIVEVKSDEPFPCDLILLHSSAENNECMITTANLDGETNLKVEQRNCIVLRRKKHDFFYNLIRKNPYRRTFRRLKPKKS